MRPTQLAIPLGLILATLAPPTDSAAQPPATSSVAPADAAAGLYEQGNALYKKGDFRGAESKYLQAWAIAKTFDVAANLGIVELELKKYREAAEHLAFSLRNAPPSTKPAQRESTRQSLEEAKKHVGMVRLSVRPAGASVLIDGQAVAPEMAAAEIFVVPGKRTITATLAEHEPATATIEVMAGGSTEVSLTLKEKPKVEPPPPATATATAQPPPPTRSAVPIFVLGGAAVVALGVGIGLNASAASDNTSVKSTSEDILSKKGSCVPGAPNFDARCPALESQARNAQTLSGLSVGLMIGAGIVAGGAVLYWLLPGAPPVKVGAAVVPEQGRVAGAMSLSGQF